MPSGSLAERDARALWHPATHFDDLERVPVEIVERAAGCDLWLADGRRILDGVSSWWTSVHGHGHPAIVAAVREQVAQLDHVMFAGFSHRPAIELAEGLLAAAPPGYGRVFFADCGSAAVEVALKLSYQARRQRGEPQRARYAVLRGGYHGETLGSLALTDLGDYRRRFADLLFEPIVLPTPAFTRHEPEDAGRDLGADAPELEAALAQLHAHASEITALVVEPLCQCARKMTMTGAGYYRRLVETAQSLGIHVIADEIAVAFFRTGRLFASSWAGVTPDLLCLSKGLSGGVLPLSCVLVRQGFEDDFRGPVDRAFAHSHTFTANPIACAAGLASLNLLRAPEMPARVQACVQGIAQRRHEVARRCTAVVAHRQIGAIAAFDVASGEGRGPADGRLGLALRAAALRRGVLLRPLHDTVYWMPPLAIEDEALDRLTAATIDAITEVLG